MHPAAISSTVRNSVAGHSYVTISLFSILVALFLLAQFERVYLFLAITPASVFPPLVHVQTLVTAGFLETNILFLAVDCGAVTFAGSVFEPLWGTTKYLEFVTIVNFIGCTLCAATYIFLYIFTRNLEILFLQCNGFTCVLAGYAVAYKQANPQRKFTYMGLSIESRFGPGLLLLVTSGMYMFSFVRSHVPLMAFHGAMVAWTYLRFYQVRDDVKGDPGEGFAFADFFPMAMQPAIIVLGNRVYNIARTLRILPKRPLQYDLSQSNIVQTTLPGVSLTDAERRRQAAERDLAKRMAARGTPDQVVSQVLTDVVVVDDSTTTASSTTADPERTSPVDTQELMGPGESA
eukprot:m.65474 g.65474  ORF g.65474 m.65474 type:complete len:347 (+) comp15919_c0_seq1:190-1230(+)